ncbi:DUF4893 domain-containing protein [Sphingomonas sp. RB1R13]|uniref:DUF4893 domain-containing protein n=1 Tax=Sphingomonas sp. RB1R13 TaxID=3096159 RepID=UPI002FC8DF20
MRHSPSFFLSVSLSLAVLPLGGCASMERTLDREGALVDQPTRDWHLVATVADRARLRDWRPAFVNGLASARRSGAGPKIDAEGALLRPDAALPGPAIPNGTYRCRTIKLGAKSAGMLDFVTYPPFVCRVRQERNVQGFAKLTGSQRQVGLIFPGDAMRNIFLGTLMLGDENRAMQYGGDPDRDVAGYIERLGPRQWRLIMPHPTFESQIDVIELVPAG